MKKILVSDIDGTLIRQGEVVVDSQKLENFRKSNTFVLCTGRNYDSFSYFTKKYAFDDFDFAILSNGAMVINENFDILYTSRVSLGVLKAQVAQLVAIAGIKRLFLVINLTEIAFNAVPALSEFLNGLIDTDVLIGLTIEMTDPHHAQMCVDRLKENTSLSIQHNHSYIDIVSKCTTKKSGIKTLLSKLENGQLQVIGDGENDLPMFELTEESYTFQDAPDVVRSRASYLIEFYDEIFER